MFETTSASPSARTPKPPRWSERQRRSWQSCGRPKVVEVSGARRLRRFSVRDFGRCVRTRSRRREEADSQGKLAKTPPPHVSGYDFKHTRREFVGGRAN